MQTMSTWNGRIVRLLIRWGLSESDVEDGTPTAKRAGQEFLLIRSSCPARPVYLAREMPQTEREGPRQQVQIRWREV